MKRMMLITLAIVIVMIATAACYAESGATGNARYEADLWSGSYHCSGLSTDSGASIIRQAPVLKYTNQPYVPVPWTTVKTNW